MKMRKGTKIGIALLAVGLAVFFAFRYIGSIKRHSALEARAILQQDHNEELTKVGTIIASKEQIIRNHKKLLSEMDETIASLRKTNSAKAREIEGYKQTIEDQSKRIKKLGGKIESLTAVKAKVETKIVEKVVKEYVKIDDGMKEVFNIDYEDKWASLSGRINISDATYELTPTFNTSFTHLSYEKDGKWLTDIIFDSPYASVQTFQGFDFGKKVKATPKKWSIGISLGVDHKLRIVPSIGVHRSLIRF